MSTQDVPADIRVKKLEEKDQEKEDEEEVKTRTEVHAILGGYVSTKANNDPKLDKESSSILSECTKAENASDSSKLVGRELASIANQIEEKLGDRFTGILERLGTPDLAFQSFQRIAIRLFTMNSANGEVNVTWSRISTLMGYCYLLCSHFVVRYNSPRAVVGFFTAVVGYLSRFIIESRVLQWIRSQGGWISVLQRPPEIDLKTVAWVATCVTLIGIAVWVYLK